ncbi:MAG: class F sortase [Candidatus Zambryskibacteria bacterium]|nr:class F sortase [Candidatus Zambryskibacteria bacterium]
MKINLTAKVLIALAILIALFAVWRGMTRFDNDEVADTGIYIEETTGKVLGTQSGEVTQEQLPSRLLIPKLNIDAHVQRLGITDTGNMAAPDNFTDVSWYKYGSVPGFKGSSVMSGHEDNAISLDGVFKHLEDLEIGDDVYVVREDGERLHFKVIDEQIYPYDNSPLERIFNTQDGTYLNLITCAGDWVPAAKTNDKRLVIFTQLVE